MDQRGQQDSPLSTSSNIVGILTFVVAIAAAVYARFTYLRNSDAEYFRVKTSLSWYKTESAWLAELLAALNVSDNETPAVENGGGRNGIDRGYFEKGGRQKTTEHQMYAFVMDDLLNLERRLLDIVTEVEAKSALAGSGTAATGHAWPLVPRSWQGGRQSVAMAWLPVRTKAMELVRQREALTTRVQFLQMSMVYSRLRELEARTQEREDRSEGIMIGLREEVRRLEGVVEQRIPVDGTGVRDRRFGRGDSGFQI